MQLPHAKTLSAEKPISARRNESPAAESFSSSLFVLLKIGICPARLCRSFATHPTLPETSRFSEEVPCAF